MSTLATPEVLTQSTSRVDSAQEGLPVRILALCALVFLLAWLPRLYWGFWTDEAGTFWMVCKGWREARSRTATWPGRSITYSVLDSFFVSAGLWKEPLLRVPSVLAIVGSLRWAEADPATSRLFAAPTAYPLRNRTIPLP
jgi:hypothetical protein